MGITSSKMIQMRDHNKKIKNLQVEIDTYQKALEKTSFGDGTRESILREINLRRTRIKFYQDDLLRMENHKPYRHTTMPEVRIPQRH